MNNSQWFRPQAWDFKKQEPDDVGRLCLIPRSAGFLGFLGPCSLGLVCPHLGPFPDLQTQPYLVFPEWIILTL